MKVFSVLLLLIGAVLCLLGISDLVTMFTRGDLAGSVGTIGVVVNGAIFLVGILFVGVALVMRKLADKQDTTAKG